MLPGQVGATGAGNDGADVIAQSGGCLQCGSRARVGAQVTQGQVQSGCVEFHPTRDHQQAMREQREVKAGVVVQHFGHREQVQHQGTHTLLIQGLGNSTTRRVVTAAVMAGGQQHQAAGLAWQGEHAFNVDIVHGNRQELRFTEVHAFILRRSTPHRKRLAPVPTQAPGRSASNFAA